MTYLARYINSTIEVNGYVNIIDSLFDPQDNTQMISGKGSLE